MYDSGSQSFSLVVSRRCPGLCPGGPVVSLLCRGGVPVVSRRCNGPVSVMSRRCPNSVPVVFRVSVVSRCRIAGPLVSRSCAGGVPVVSRSCPGAVPEVSRWCPGGVAVCPVVSRWLVFQCCSMGVVVVSRLYPRAPWVLVVFHPVVSRSRPVFHAVARPDHHSGKSATVGRLVSCW